MTSTLRLLRSTRYLLMLALVAFLGAATNANAQQTCSPNPPTWCVNPADFQSSMTVTGQLIIGETASTDTDDLMAAFIDGEVRGWVAGSTFSNETRYYLTIYGNPGAGTVTFKAFDASANEVRSITETMSFTADGIVGSPGSPFLFHAPDGVPPEQVTLDTPANSTTSLPVDVPIELAWIEAADAVSYDLQVDDDAAFGSPEIDETGLTGLPHGAAGLQRGTTYHWRVRGINGNGDGPWSSAFSFTTLLNEPAAPPTLATPDDGATGTSLTPTLDWDALADATSYDVQLATDPAFSSLLLDEADLTATEINVPGSPLSQGTMYYWRARGANEGGAGPWATAFTFITSLDAPTLATPSNGATNQPTTLTLAWTTVVQANAYDLQVATDAGFSAIVDEQTGLANTSGEVTDLNRGVTYHWRVRSTSADAVSLWSTAFTFTTLIDAPAAPPSLASPFDGAELTILTPQLQWQSTAGASAYDVQLATDPAFSNLLIDQAGVGTLQLHIPAGILAFESTYYWRVRGTNVGGTGPWATGFQFHTLEPPPDIPTLTSPQNGAINQLLSLVLAWEAAARATSYELQVAINPGFTSPIINETGLDELTDPLTNLDPATIYFWRVRAVNGTGAGAWSDPFSFATKLVAPSGAPSLTTPEEGGTTVQEPLLRWQAVDMATSYEVQIATSSGFSEITYEARAVPGTSQQVPVGALSTETTYYWRVRGSNLEGDGPWSGAHSFLTQQVTLATPTLTTPANEASGQQLSLTLRWNTVGGATRYDILVASTPSFETIVAEATGLTNATFAVQSLSPATTYYWQVQARGNGTQSAWSAPWHFTTLTVAPVAAPAPETPADGTTTASQTPTLVWSPLEGASTYDVQVARDGSFSAGGAAGKVEALVHEVAGLTATQYPVPGGVLQEAVTYFWRIRGVNGAGPGPWSSPMQFTTPGTAPSVPAPQAPTDGALEQQRTVTLTWAQAAGAGSYTVQLSTDASFNTLFANLVNVQQTSITLTDLSLSTVYYWRVQAENASGLSAWSSVFRFTTLITAPTPMSPADGTVVESSSPLLEWSPIAGATRYTLEISEQTDFSRSVIYTGLVAASQRVAGLAAATVYYWRIRSQSDIAQSPWSAPAHFSTPTATNTAIERKDATVPSNFELAPNYPNPFNPATTIRFGLPEAASVRLSIYDATGRAVDEILNTRLSPGRFEVSWEAHSHPSGIYFYKLQANGRVLTGKMMLVK